MTFRSCHGVEEGGAGGGVAAVGVAVILDIYVTID